MHRAINLGCVILLEFRCAINLGYMIIDWFRFYHVIRLSSTFNIVRATHHRGAPILSTDAVASTPAIQMVLVKRLQLLLQPAVVARRAHAKEGGL